MSSVILNSLRCLFPKPASQKRGESASGEKPPRRPAPWQRLSASLRRGGAVSISVEGTSVRLLACENSRVATWTTMPFNPRLLSNGVVADPEGLGRVIDSLFQRFNLSKRRVVCGLTGQQAVSRMLTIPKAAAAHLDDVVAREARRALPSSQNAYFFWQVLSGQTDQIRVFALSVPREPILAMVETLEAAAIRPYLMDLRPLALARAIEKKNAVLANAENNSVDVVIVADDIPILMRSVFLGDSPLAPELVLGRLTDEVMRTINYYNDTNRANPLADDVPVYLTGEMVSDPSLPGTLEGMTGHPVPPLTIPLRYPPDFPLAPYMVNVGLSMKGM